MHISAKTLRIPRGLAHVIISVPPCSVILTRSFQQLLIESQPPRYGIKYASSTFAGPAHLVAANARGKKLLLWLDQHAGSATPGPNLRFPRPLPRLPVLR